MKRQLLSFLILFFICAPVFGDNLTEGYKSFSNNDLKSAYQHFNAASLLPESKAEAFLMLSFLATIDKSQEEAFNYFMEFCKYSSNPDPYIIALSHHKIFSGFNGKKSKAQIEWYLEQLKRTNLNSTLKAYLNEDVGKYYESIREIKKSREYLSRIGEIMNWQIVGDFENISASGFDKDFGPILHPEPETVFKNKIGAEVKWFNLYKQVPGKWIDFKNNFYCNNSLIYAQTFCNSPEDKVVQLRVGTSGSLKIWVNDQLLFQEKEERNNGIDNYVLPVKISKGNNRILLQIGCSKIEQCNFMMRVTDTSGEIVSNLVFSDKYSSYNKTVQEVLPLIILPAETYLMEQIDKYPDKLVNYLALATTYLSNDKTHDARRVLKQTQEIAPNCSAILIQLYELYIRSQDRTSASLVEGKLKINDTENPFVLDLRINEAFNSENYKEARQLVDRMVLLYGESKETLIYKLSLADKESKIPEIELVIKKIMEKYSNDFSLVRQKYIYEKNYKKDKKAYIKTLKDYSSTYFDKNAMQTLANEYFQLGMIKEGVDILNQLIEYMPFCDNYYQQLGSFYSNSGNFSIAKQYVEECLKIAPYYGPYHGNYAEIFAALGQKDEAINQYKTNIEFRPDDYDAIKKLRDLQSKKDVFDYFPQKDYYSIYEKSPSASDYPSDNFLSLTEEKQVVLLGNGGCELRQIILLKTLTLKGIDYIKEYSINYSSNEDYLIEKAEVLKKNGNRLKAEVKDNQVVYTNLEPGDGVLLIFRKFKNISGSMSKQFSDKYLLNSWYPSLNIEYNLLVDKNLHFNYLVEHSDLEPIVSDNDEFNLYTWKRELNKAIKLESYMPETIDVFELLSISTIPDWDYISKWYYDISNTKTEPEIEVKELVKNILNNKSGLSQKQIAQLFYNYIEQNIRYSSVSFRQNGIVPQKASDVLITRIGDCKDFAVLFTSMCKAAGIKAEIALVIRRQSGTRWMNLASFDFEHAIAKATLDEKDYYIELTSSYYPFGALGEGLLGSMVLDINNDLTSKATIKVLNPGTRLSNNIKRESKVFFTDDNMTCSVESNFTGAIAAERRERYRDFSKEEREDNFVKIITNDYANVKLERFEFDSTLYNCSDTLNYQYGYTIPKVFAKINDMQILKLPLADGMNPMDFLSLEERKFPIETWQYSNCDTIVENMTIVFPKNKRLIEVPKSVNYSCNQADYSLTFKQEGNELKVVRKIVYKTDIVPVVDYASYRSFIESVVNTDGQQIGFK